MKAIESVPHVSIIIPAYNSQKTLADAIQSAVRQSYTDTEVIVVDDGSTDGTREVVAHFPSVTYHYQDNAGPAAARNTGMELASGNLLLFLDGDDVLKRHMLAQCLLAFEQYPVAGVVYVDYEWVGEDLQAPAQGVVKAKIDIPPDQILQQLLTTAAGFFPPCCALVRADLAQRVGGFDERLISTEDWHFWVKLAAAGVHFQFVRQSLALYRYVEDSLSNNPLRFYEMRLQAYQALRDIDLPDTYDLEAMIAGRHHALAMKYWQHGRGADARQHFRMANRLRSEGRLARWLLIAGSFVMSADRATELLKRRKT